MTGKLRFLFASLALAGVLFSASTASAVAVSWTVDSALSAVTFTAAIGPGFADLLPQGAGSTTASYTGTVSGDITGSTLTISSGLLDALVTGVWSPLPGGAPGAAPADYGHAIYLLPSGPVIGTDAVRGVLLDVAKAPTTVTAGSWDATGTAFTFLAGDLDYDVPAFATSGTEPLAGIGSGNLPSGGTLTTIGLTETLMIPVAITDSTSLDLSGIPVVIMITGTIVATRAVPEPGTFVMLGLGAAMLVPMAVRRYRKRG